MPLLLALLPKKICASCCVCLCVGWVVVFFVFFKLKTDRGSMKINNVSVTPEVLNSGVQEEEKKT